MCFENTRGMYVTVVYKERSLLEVTWLADVSRRLETFPAWIRTRCDSCDLLIGTYKAGRSSQTQLAARIPISLYKVNLSVRLGSIQKPVLRNSPVFCHVVRHVAKTISARLASSVPQLAGHLYLNYKPFTVKKMQETLYLSPS